MPKFFKQNPSTQPNLDPTHELPSGENIPFDSEDYFLGFENPYNSVYPLLSWKAASRPFRKKDRSYYTTVIILIVLVSLIALLAGEKLLIGVLLALLFLIYVLNFTPPEEIDYKISTQGITIKDHFYHWFELDSFWFSEKEGFKVLDVLTRFRFPGLLMLVLGPSTGSLRGDSVEPGQVNQEDVKRACAKYLPFHEIAPKTTLEKWAEGLQKHFPLENPHK